MRKAMLLLIAFAMSLPCLQAQLAFYEHYAVHDELLVALAEGYRLDSVTRVNVVLIQAKDSAAWEWVMEEFQITSLTDIEISRLQKGGDVRFSNIIDNQICPILLQEDPESIFIMAGSHKERVICVFFTETEKQRNIILYNQLHIIKKNIK